MKVFYNKKQNAKSLSSVSPSASKPRLVVQAWKAAGLPVEVISPRPASITELCYAHDSKYVHGILSCKIKNGFDDKQKDVAKSLPWTVGSFLSAAKHAHTEKVTTFSPTSGFHHAKYNSAAGFCTFSGLTIAAVALHKMGAKRIGILDLDSHSGDGTDDTLKKAEAEDYVEHYSLGYDDVDQYNNTQWLKALPERLKQRFSDCDVLFYQAGVDCHIDDPNVDRGHFTTEQLKQRDEVIFRFCKDANIPAVVNLAGGYQVPIAKVVDLHVNTALAWQTTQPSSEALT